MNQDCMYIVMKEVDGENLELDYIDTLNGPAYSFEELFNAFDIEKVKVVWVADSALQFSYLIEWAQNCVVSQAKGKIYSLTHKGITFKSVDHIYNAPFECICRDFKLGKPSAKAVNKLVDIIDNISKFSFRRGEFQTAGGVSWLCMTRARPGDEEILNARYNNWFNLEDYNMFKKFKIYRGGLCLVNHEYAGKTIEGLYKYDKNSFFPWAMATANLPGGPFQYYSGRSYSDDDLLHVRLSGTNKFKGLAPLSICGFEAFDFFGEEKWLWGCELRELMNWYDLDIEYLGYYHWLWNQPDDILGDFVHKYYEAKNSTTGIEQRGNKLIINNGYGKWAQEPVTTCKSAIKEGKLITHDKHLNFYKVRSLAVAAKITSVARTELLRSIREATHNRPDLYYIYGDTDSMILTIPYDKVGKELGEFKFEGYFEKGKVLSKKCYMLYDGARYECHACGVNRSALESEINNLDWDAADKRFNYGETFMCPTRVKVNGGKKIVMTPRVLSNGLDNSVFDQLYGVYEGE